jgi:hypothetical protein
VGGFTLLSFSMEIVVRRWTIDTYPNTDSALFKKAKPLLTKDGAVSLYGER